MPDHRLLPSEIWLGILRWATTSDKELNLITATYAPFQPTPNDAFDPIITVKRTIVLVCREWNQLASEFLYENLVIYEDALALKDALDRDRVLCGFVRRVVLPYPSTYTAGTHKPLPALDSLRLCPNIETLVRPRLAIPEALQFHFEAENFPSLPLKRLDWCYYNEAERSGGINSLSAVLQSSPNLRYLSVGGIIGFGHILTDTSPLSLPELETLRLNWSSGLFLRQLVELWSLPALTRIVLDIPLADLGLERIWETFGSQLRTVEFGKHVRFLMNDHITSCLRGCPNLTELNYFLFFNTTPNSEIRHESITTIALHAAVNELLQDGGQICTHIEEHFYGFMSDVYPALRKILLYGQWRGIISHPRLAPMWQALKNHGIEFIGC